MKVSIVVIVRNNQEMIGDCIESRLNQDCPKEDYAIIIVDNNSTDKTADAIIERLFTYLKQLMEGRIPGTIAYGFATDK